MHLKYHIYMLACYKRILKPVKIIHIIMLLHVFYIPIISLKINIYIKKKNIVNKMINKYEYMIKKWLFNSNSQTMWPSIAEIKGTNTVIYIRAFFSLHFVLVENRSYLYTIICFYIIASAPMGNIEALLDTVLTAYHYWTCKLL